METHQRSECSEGFAVSESRSFKSLPDNMMTPKVKRSELDDIIS